MLWYSRRDFLATIYSTLFILLTLAFLKITFDINRIQIYRYLLLLCCMAETRSYISLYLYNNMYLLSVCPDTYFGKNCTTK